jgi:hypothetical protein
MVDPKLCGWTTTWVVKVFDQIPDEHRAVGVTEVFHDLGAGRALDEALFDLIDGHSVGRADQRVTGM